MSATVEITNDIALIRMDDGKANAINFEMIAALNTALERSSPPRFFGAGLAAAGSGAVTRSRRSGRAG